MKSSTRDKVEGTARQLAGSVKKSTGKVTNNPRLEAEGRVDQSAGKVQKKVGEVKKVFGR